jgi:hypothetical protein
MVTQQHPTLYFSLRTSQSRKAERRGHRFSCNKSWIFCCQNGNKLSFLTYFCWSICIRAAASDLQPQRCKKGSYRHLPCLPGPPRYSTSPVMLLETDNSCQLLSDLILVESVLPMTGMMRIRTHFATAPITHSWTQKALVRAEEHWQISFKIKMYNQVIISNRLTATAVQVKSNYSCLWRIALIFQSLLFTEWQPKASGLSQDELSSKFWHLTMKDWAKRGMEECSA